MLTIEQATLNLATYSNALLRAHEFVQRAVDEKTDWILNCLGDCAAAGLLLAVPDAAGRVRAVGIFGLAPARDVLLKQGRLTPDRLSGGDCLTVVWMAADPGYAGRLIRLARARWPDARLIAGHRLRDGKLHHKPLRAAGLEE